MLYNNIYSYKLKFLELIIYDKYKNIIENLKFSYKSGIEPEYIQICDELAENCQNLDTIEIVNLYDLPNKFTGNTLIVHNVHPFCNYDNFNQNRLYEYTSHVPFYDNIIISNYRALNTIPLFRCKNLTIRNNISFRRWMLEMPELETLCLKKRLPELEQYYAYNENNFNYYIFSKNILVKSSLKNTSEKK
jgi:hypothetical protein